ncbi:ankyrin [Imleria badia]|nr:ankyrin [Imleria badia]
MAYISFCLEEMKDCRQRSCNATRERDLVSATSYASRPLLKYVLSDGFSHLAHLGPGSVDIFKDMETLQAVICQHAWEWDRMCKSVPSMIRSGIPWPTSEHDFTMYTLVAFASDALFHTFLDRSPITPREGTNPLVYAAHFGKTEHARALILRGANVNHRGFVIGKLAVDDSDMVNMDVERLDADDSDSNNSIADYSDERKALPIHVAVDHWHAEMLDLLIEQGSPIQDGFLTRVLNVQPHQLPLYIVRRLLQTPEFVKWAAAPWDNRRLLEALVEDGEDYDQIHSGDELMLVTRGLVQAGFTESLLLVAVENGCIFVIRTLLSVATSLPSDVLSASYLCAIANALATNGDTPLHIAMRLSDENRCLIITKLLVEAGCDPCELDAEDKPPIQAAVARGFVSVVEYLLSRDVPLPSRILSVALQAIVVKRVEMIRLLVNTGANLHVLKPDGDALLHITMRSLDRSVSLEIARILIDVGCNPLSRNVRGEAPLHIAAKQGYHEIVNYLIQFSSSSDISSLLQDDPVVQAATLRSLVGTADGLHFPPEEEAGVMHVVQEFLDDRDKCLECAKLCVNAASDLQVFARSSGSAMLSDIALKQGFSEVVEYLTSQSVPLAPGILFTALRYYRVSIFTSLIRGGADVHARDSNGDTLLHFAMWILLEPNCLSSMKILVEAGCDPFVLNTANKQPIDIAASRVYLSVVEYLLPRYFNAKATLPPIVLFTALQRREKLSKIRLLVDHTADLSYIAPNGDLLLHPVLMEILEKPMCLLILMETNTEIVDHTAYFPYTPPNGSLDSEFKTNEYECLQTTQLLCEAGCPFAPNARGQTPLHLAITRGFTSVFDYLLSRNVPVPSDILFCTLDTQFSRIFFNGNTEKQISTISRLVHKGANVRARGPNGGTLLHHVITMRLESDCVQLTELFIKAGCSASVRDDYGRLPIEVAATRTFPSVVECLLSHNAPFPPNILFTMMERQSVLSPDARRMMSSFVEHGADVSATAANGNTVLHVALACEVTRPGDPIRLLDVVDVLVTAGCSTHTRDAKGRTPLEVAVARQFSEIAEYLQPISALPSPP